MLYNIDINEALEVDMKKIRTTCRKGETTAEYSKLGEVDSLRKNVLRFILDKHKQDMILFIDTNNGIRSFTKEKLKEAMTVCNLENIIEEVSKPERKLIGISVPLKKREKKDSDKVYIALASIDEYSDLNVLYDRLLESLDYALFASAGKSPEELISHFRRGPEDVLFNKTMFDFTFYDSVLIKRMRIDNEDRELVELIEKYR
jgi:hypothetical protein